MTKKQYESRPGYSGPVLETVPTGLRTRVEVAAQAASRVGGFTLNLVEVGPESEGGEWRFGDYTDVLVMHNRRMHASHHLADGQRYRIFLTGGGGHDTLEEIAQGLGLDPALAEEIPGEGWIHDPSAVSEITQHTTAAGPYYGIRLE